MNWVQFKDLLCYLWLLAQEIAGSSTAFPFLNYIILVTKFAEFSENIWGKLDWSSHNYH